MAKAAKKKIDKLGTSEIAGPLRNRIVGSGEEDPENCSPTRKTGGAIRRTRSSPSRDCSKRSAG